MARYRALPITQRDGSKLESSNCRMASIATGIDYHTLGSKTSTGAAMRSRQGDQNGGTDSGDAKAAWSSYQEALRVKDGSSWDEVIGDLRAGRLVHLDVWHATVGGPCLSGSGAYGHTMAVAPESSGTRWLVADPWCKPPRWSWVEEAKLRAGALKWGSQVYTKATAGTHGPIDEYELVVLMILAGRELMELYHPGGREAPEDPPDTGGAGGRVLYTTTKAQQADAAGGSDDMGIYWNPARWTAGKDIAVFTAPDWKDKVTEIKKGSVFTTLGPKAVTDSDGRDTSARAVLVQTGGLVPGTTDPTVKAVLWAKGADFPADSDPTNQAWDDSIWRLALDPSGRWPCPPPPPTPGDDCDKRVATALETRDLEWEEALKAGEAWPSTT